MRRLLTGLAALTLLGTTLPALAAEGDTTATFTIQAGGLSISVPASADLGTVAAGATTVAGQLGTVTVVDDRAALVAEWVATVSATDFTTGGAGESETVANTNVAYSSGAATAAEGNGVFTPSVGLTLGVPGVAGAWVGVGSNSVSWNPTFTLTLLGSQVAGTYEGTVTHSVL